jgi:hypothetical protein
MRALLTFASLLIVLAVIAVSVRSQLRADKRFLPAAAAASGASSAPFGGSSSPSVAQFQRELDKTLSEAASHREAEAASAGEDGAR